MDLKKREENLRTYLEYFRSKMQTKNASGSILVALSGVIFSAVITSAISSPNFFIISLSWMFLLILGLKDLIDASTAHGIERAIIFELTGGDPEETWEKMK